ncbi:MAG: DHH family phosphoesterase [Phycisphaerae bacterium]
MCEKSAGSGFERVAQRLAAAGKLLFVTHARPDGDCLGSLVAMTLAARGAGKGAEMLVPDAVPMRYQFLFARRLPASTDRFAALADAADLVVILDTSVFAQLDGLEQAITARQDKVVVIDHHATAGQIGSAMWNDSTAAAAGILMKEMIDHLGWPLDGETAEALMTAITSDTGWFHFSNTDGRCLRTAADLLDAGVRTDLLNHKLFQCDRPERLKLMVRMLESLELHAAGRLAVMEIRKADFAATGAMPEETENLINEPLRLGSVEAVILLTESDALVRVSLRSRDVLDVSQIAKGFGGGGHKRAAGLRSTEPIEVIKPRLIAACLAALDA